jgi:hypothetical protein
MEREAWRGLCVDVRVGSPIKRDPALRLWSRPSIVEKEPDRSPVPVEITALTAGIEPRRRCGGVLPSVSTGTTYLRTMPVILEMIIWRGTLGGRVEWIWLDLRLRRLFPRWCSENHSPVGESGAMTRSQKMGFGNLLVELVGRISGIRRLAVKKKRGSGPTGSDNWEGAAGLVLPVQ